MNRILKQRIYQISRQNNYLLIARASEPRKIEAAGTKMMAARPVVRAESTTAADFRRG